VEITEQSWEVKTAVQLLESTVEVTVREQILKLEITEKSGGQK
jgi:hypothetical protein